MCFKTCVLIDTRLLSLGLALVLSLLCGLVLEVMLDHAIDGLTFPLEHQRVRTREIKARRYSQGAELVENYRKTTKINDLNHSLFVVVDQFRWEQDGVVLNFKYLLNAIRPQAKLVGDGLPYLNIGYTISLEILCNGHRPWFPRQKFAVARTEVTERFETGVFDPRKP
jgi:hypothetical protein